MPSVAKSQDDYSKCGASTGSVCSWHPLELERGNQHHHDEQEHDVVVSSPPKMVPSTPRNRSHDEDEDAVSLLSDPGGTPNLLRRRGRRRDLAGQRYHPLHLSLSQVTTESKACFPVYGCASFLLSLLVAAIFVIPPPRNQNQGDFALLPCRQQVWQRFGYPVFLDEGKNDNNEAVAGNRTSEQDWSWFLQMVDQTKTMDRCRNEQEGMPSVPRYCVCNNPTKPWDPDTAVGDDEAAIEYTQLWESAFFEHQARLKNETTLPLFTDIELVLVGDSLTEHWMGTSIGRPKAPYAENAQVFRKLLRDNHEKRPYVHSTAFGISGDRCGQALYRIQNGAVIPTEPRLGVLTVFWVWIGTNDIIRDHCQPEQVAGGTVAIVRELRERRPDAWVVVQSLLPSENAEPALVNSINQATKCLTDSTKKTFYYNSSSVFMIPFTNTVNASRFVSDGIHPNAEGSRAWARSMLDYLRTLYDARYYH